MDGKRVKLEEFWDKCSTQMAYQGNNFLREKIGPTD